MGSDFFFGFPETQVQEWNGSSWDTLSQAVNNVFTPFLDLEWDKDGNLWMLQMFHDVFSIRYGQQWYRFKAADMPGDVELFTCFAEDPNGGMWIGTDDGLIFYDGFRFEHTPSTEIGIISDLLPKLTILNIAIDEAGTKWLALSAEGIRKQEVGKNWEIVEFEWPSEDLPGIDKIVCGTYPELWADLSQQGVLHFDGSEWKHYNSENAGFPVTHINNIMAAPNGRVWFTTYQSVTVYDPRGQGIAPYQLPEQNNIEVYPNPGCCQYEVHWQAEVAGQYSISLYNTSGQQLRQWQKEVFLAGEASFNFQDNNLPAGTYVLNIIQEMDKDILYLAGDATQDDTLVEAGIENARGLIAALGEDSENLFIVLSARQLNPKLTIVSRAIEERSQAKLIKAGANHVVMPENIGGFYMAMLMNKPGAVEFFSFITSEYHSDMGFEELHYHDLPDAYQGRPISDMALRSQTGANIIGYRNHRGRYQAQAEGREVAIYAKIKVKLNDGKYHPYVDETRDLAQEEWSMLWPSDWILPEGSESE
eukprot:g622.t1